MPRFKYTATIEMTADSYLEAEEQLTTAVGVVPNIQVGMIRYAGTSEDIVVPRKESDGEATTPEGSEREVREASDPVRG